MTVSLRQHIITAWRLRLLMVDSTVCTGTHTTQPHCITTTLPDDDDDDIRIDPVTCGSFVKLTHVETGFDLSSEPKNSGSGSGQQIVTFMENASTHNALWWIRPANHDEDREYPLSSEEEQTCELAMPIPCGSIVRLTHASTMKNLHSHNFKSPLSNQQEVSAYGTGDGNGDGGDNWIVQCQGNGQRKHWQSGEMVRLFHRDSKKLLGAAKNAQYNRETCGQNCPIMDHLEAFCRSNEDSHSLMVVQQGVHLSK
jgi:dolichyl-phosphate-mannose--protein O-mannosyl transferase